MPARLHLTGTHFGHLSVLHAGEVRMYGGKPVQFWVCQCDKCQRIEEIPQTKLVGLDCCTVCRRGPCVACGGEVPDSRPRSDTCCESCHQQRKREIWNKNYSKLVSDNPEFNKKRVESMRERRAEDPVYAAHVKELSRAADRRYFDKPGNRERAAEYGAQWYADNKAAIQAERKRIYASLTPAEQAVIREERRNYQREYKRRYREWLKANPTELAQHQERYREWANEYARLHALSDLRIAAQSLQDKLNNEKN